MRQDGLTLIELIVVIAIISILAIVTGFEFVGWMARYRVESQIKEMHADLMSARVRAMQKNRAHFATGTATTYSIYEDTTPAPDGDGTLQVATDRLLPSFPKTVQYALTWAGGTVVFDRRGIIEPTASPLGATLCVFTQNDPDSDCIIIAPTRMNIGKILNQGGACDAANCQAK